MKTQTQKDKGIFSNFGNSLFRKKDSLLKKCMPQVVGIAIILFITALIFFGAVLKFETSAYADQPDNTSVPASTDIIDTNLSDHPSGKDRNVEPGNSGAQGKSESNPDKDGIDKPYPADGQQARSQGRNDNDGNNGCGNDNDFSDDNNGNCGGKKKETPTPRAPTPTPVPPEATPTPPTATPIPTVLPGVTPITQPVGVIPSSVVFETEKIFQPQPTPIPLISIPAVELPKILPKAGEIPFVPVWLSVIGISLVVAGLKLKNMT